MICGRLLAVLSLSITACGGGMSSPPDARPADAAPPVADARADAAAPDAGPPGTDITVYLVRDVTALLSLAGTYRPVEAAETGVVDFWGVVRLGAAQAEGVLLGGWAFTGFGGDPSKFKPVEVMLLAQRADGTLEPATSTLLPSATTNGIGSVLVADFNADGKDDIFLPAHNESPFVAKASTAYLSKPDGTFSMLTVADRVMAHGASVATLDGAPVVLVSSFAEDGDPSPLRQPVYRYGANGFTVTEIGGGLGSMMPVAGDFAGDGSTQVVLSDALFGPGYPYAPDNAMIQVLWPFVGGALVEPPTFLPAPRFNTPAYAEFESQWDPYSKTHTSRLWVDDVNHDGMLDLVAGAEIWSGARGPQKMGLQILQNQGGLVFADRTAALNPDYDEDVLNFDYSLRFADVDGSGIDTILAAPYTFCSIDGCRPQRERQGNYILVNDGSGRLHVAMHDEFLNLAGQVIAFADERLPARWSVNPVDVPRFIAYRTADGKLSFVAAIAASEDVAGQAYRGFALVSMPLRIDLATDFRRPLTVMDRNGSRRIRTFAGDDTIAGGGGTVDGGLGRDTVVYDGPMGRYTVSRGASTVMVTDTMGGAVDTLTRVEALRFADGAMEL
jgi:hypothetical protein